jgi:hypothetical protein
MQLRRSPRAVACTFVAGATAWLAACSLIVNGSEYRGDRSPNGDDASIDAPEDSLPKVQDGASTADGEGGVDPPTSCRDTIFDDFDTPPLGAKWDEIGFVGPLLTLDSTDSRSAPSSLRVEIDAGVVGSGFLKKRVSQAKLVCCEFDARFERVANTFFAVQGPGAFDLYVRGGQAANDAFRQRYYGTPDGGGVSLFGTLPKLDDDTWHRMIIRIAFPPGPGKGTVEVTIDGTVRARSPLGFDDSSITMDEIIFGAWETSSSDTPRAYRFDNVGCLAQ